MVEKRMVRVREAEIEYFVEGGGDVVVLVPGFGVDVNYFKYLSSRLADDGFCAVAVNPRGVGGSSGSTEDLTLHTYGADVAAVIETLDCGPVHVLGHAYGNRITRCLAVDRPELIRSLILLAAPGSAKAADPEVASALANWTRDDATEAECIEVLELMVGDPATAPSIWRQLRRDAAFAREQSAALRTPPIDYYEGGGDKPLFIVQGLADRSAPPENARQLHDRFPARVRLVEMAGVGHMPFLEQPETVADALLSFLQEQ